MSEEAQKIETTFFQDVNWDRIAYNRIDEDSFNRILARYPKLYATFLGKEDEYTFFMFKKLSWPEFKDIRARKLDKDGYHDYILNNCIVWPKMDAFAMNELEAGMALTLVYQILVMSNFFKDPNKALELILEVK